jgi:hypothetical protein
VDNPHLLATNYGATLQALPEPLRSQLLYGDFTVGRKDDAWQVIPTAWLVAAMERWQATQRPPVGQALSCVGADVAYGGADATVVSARYGPWFAELKKYKGAITDSGPKAAYLILQEHDGKAPVQVDSIGYGAPCLENLRDKLHHLAIGVNVAKTTEMYDRSGRYRLTNMRAAMWWKLREALDPDTGANLALPPDAELLADLCAPRFSVRASGIIVEPKEDIKKRIGRSPDCGDAVCLAHLPAPVWEIPSSIPNPPMPRSDPPRMFGADRPGQHRRRLFGSD